MQEREEDLGQSASELWRSAVRRRWYIIIPMVVASLAMTAFSLTRPNIYESHATVGIVQQQVSARYGTPDTQPTNQIVDEMIDQILSRPSLFQIAKRFHLYTDRESEPTSDQLAVHLGTDLHLELLHNNPAEVSGIAISYVSTDPKVAQQITSYIASMFMEENLKIRSNQVQSTTSFLTDEVDAKASQLAQQEARLQDFKRRYAGQLPEQQQGNLNTLSDLRSRLQLAVAGESRAKQARTELETVIRERMMRAQTERDALLTQYTPRHEKVVRKDAEIAGISALSDLLAHREINPRQVLALNADPSFPSFRQQIESNDEAARDAVAQEKQLSAQISEYETRLSVAPLRDQELSDITRDYNLVKQDYDEVKKNQMLSQRLSKLSQREDSQHFRMVDPPSLPVVPSGPKRLSFGLGGLLGGLLLGAGFAARKELTDRSFHSEDSLRRAYGVPLVVGIPQIKTSSEQFKGRIHLTLEWAVASVLFMSVALAEFYIYRKG